ncbi:carcinoembryonic antigen-related cell adhesion molecule 5-like, partial [Ruditapes philippinarum]|uniref:carcinoembryonic antigen-related cell adhesion molecule 5-like n=1 Tax=Ruditapes philippinarum TaxID=129788 RepID=UPI00295A6A83
MFDLYSEKCTKMLIFALTIMEIIVYVKSWPCESPIRKTYSRVNSSATLQFTADLNGLDALGRPFEVKFYNGTGKARITFYSDKDPRPSHGPDVSITGDSDGNVDFTLANVQENNAGVYIMVTPGFATKCSCLYILGTPRKPTVTVNKTPSVGESVTLTCSSTSTTTPSNHSLSLTYSWRVDNTDNPGGAKYTYTPSKDKLTVNNIVKEDANKQFTCTAKEDVTGGYTSSRSDTSSFVVYYGPDNVAFSPSDTSYEKDENESLNQVTCTASCHPTCSFTWTKTETGTLVSSSALLNLERLQSSDAGTYRCTARRTGGSPQSRDLTVNVIYGPYQSSTQLSPSTQNYTKNEGQSLNDITCSAECYPDCTYTWRKTRQEQTTTVSSTSVLSIGQLHREEAALYTCSAKNPERSSSPSTTIQTLVNVRYGPNTVSLNVTSPYDVLEEKSLIIQCKAECYPGCSYAWLNVTSGLVMNTTGAVMYIGTVNKYMTGDYKCEAKNNDASIYVKAADIVVTINIIEQTFLKWFYIGSHVNTTVVTVDELEFNIIFTCTVSGDPAENIKITHHGQILQEKQNASSLKFIHKTVNCYDSGEYKCEVRNRNMNTSSGNISMFVNCSPRPVRKIQEKLTVPLDAPVTLTFQALAHPEPGPKGFAWYNFRDTRWLQILTNEDFQISSSGLETNLTIFSVSQNDYGQYRVTTINSIGTYNQYFSLLQQEPASQQVRKEDCKDGDTLTIGIVLGTVSLILTIYATSITVLWKRNVSFSKNRSSTLMMKNIGINRGNELQGQTTYVNMNSFIKRPGRTATRLK